MLTFCISVFYLLTLYSLFVWWARDDYTLYYIGVTFCFIFGITSFSFSSLITRIDLKPKYVTKQVFEKPDGKQYVKIRFGVLEGNVTDVPIAREIWRNTGKYRFYIEDEKTIYCNIGQSTYLKYEEVPETESKKVEKKL